MDEACPNGAGVRDKVELGIVSVSRRRSLKALIKMV